MWSPSRSRVLVLNGSMLHIIGIPLLILGCIGVGFVLVRGRRSYSAAGHPIFLAGSSSSSSSNALFWISFWRCFFANYRGFDVVLCSRALRCQVYLKEVLLPFIVAMFIVYLLRPMVNMLTTPFGKVIMSGVRAACVENTRACASNVVFAVGAVPLTSSL